MLNAREQRELSTAGGGSPFRLAVVSAVSGYTVRLLFDGEDAAGEKYYKFSKNLSLSVGDRVLCAAVSGTWVVIAEI